MKRLSSSSFFSRVKYPFLILSLILIQYSCQAQPMEDYSGMDRDIEVGAAQMDEYLPLLKGKKVAILTNNTALLNGVLTVDTLVKRGVKIVKIFGPEHGFRGTGDAGAKIEDGVDPKTGIPVVSLYGKHDKPTPDDLKGVDLMMYDIQDVGVRFYTYIQSMQLFMEAAYENNIPFIILDRPNPLGYYVDGPVLEKGFESLVGMQPIPVVYGMTIGEYAKMLIGENWIGKKKYNPGLTVIKCKNYTHSSTYQLPVKPSPNLKTMASVYLYPSTCFFEGTNVSEGRGTDFPFQLFGYPKFPNDLYSFTPVSMDGATHPKLMGQKCYGFLIAKDEKLALAKTGRHLQLKWLLEAYNLFPNKDSFFLKSRHFDLLAGSDKLRKEILAGWSEDKIRASWQPALNTFKQIRKKYLLYPDFTE